MIIVKFFFFLIGLLRGFRNAYKSIGKSRVIYSIISENSFGHKVTQLDYLARMYKNERVKLFVVVDDKEVNSYLFELYCYYFEYNYIMTFSSRYKLSRKASGAEKMGIVRGIIIFSTFTKENFLIPCAISLYRVLNPFEIKMSVYDFNKSILTKYETFYSHQILLDLIQLEKFGLDKKNINIVQEFIYAKTNNKGKIVSFLFRNDAHKHVNKHDQLRDSGMIENYKKSIDLLVAKGYNILIDGVDFNDDFFSCSNVINIRSTSFDKKLLNIFMLTMSEFLVCQHSGPLHLANIARVPLVISDFLPLWQGSCGKNDIFVPKKFYKQNTLISLRDIFTSYEPLFFGAYDQYPDIEIKPSDPEEIYEAVAEMEGVISGRDEHFPEIKQKLLEEYHKYVPAHSLHAYRGNRISYHLLKREFS